MNRLSVQKISLIITRNGKWQERALKNEAEYAATLREYFGGASSD